MVLVGLVMLAGSFGLFEYELTYGPAAGSDRAEAVARTAAMNVFAMAQVAYLFNCRHLRRSAVGKGFWSNRWAFAGAAAMVLLQVAQAHIPVLNVAFHTAPMTFESWLRILAVAAALFVLVEVEIRWVNRSTRR